MVLFMINRTASLWFCVLVFFFFQAEDGIRDLVRSRGLGDVYKRQGDHRHQALFVPLDLIQPLACHNLTSIPLDFMYSFCLLYTSDAADERSSVDLGGRRIIKKKKQSKTR